MAGAGTGKTTVIARRIAHLIASGRARPSQILALTFNEKAAAEMQERVDVLVPYGYADTYISTFHAFGEDVISSFGIEIGIAPGFTVLDQTAQALFLSENLNELGLSRYSPLSDPTKYLRELVRFFNKLKDYPIPAERLREFAEGILATAGAQIVVTGTKEEEHLVNAVITAMKAEAQNLCGCLSLGGLAGLLSRCRVLTRFAGGFASRARRNGRIARRGGLARSPVESEIVAGELQRQSGAFAGCL